MLYRNRKITGSSKDVWTSGQTQPHLKTIPFSDFFLSERSNTQSARNVSETQMKLLKGDKIPTFILLLCLLCFDVYRVLPRTKAFPDTSYSFLWNSVVNYITLAKFYVFSVTSEDLCTIEWVAISCSKRVSGFS